MVFQVAATGAESLPQPSCAVLVMSCDAYSDLWPPFFHLFWRYWSDCPWPVYLGTNQKSSGGQRVTVIAAGNGEWSQRLRICLDQLDTDFVLLLLEDYFFDQPVSTSLLAQKLATLASLNGEQLRLFPLPGPDRKLESHPDIGIIHPRAAYRVSTQAAIWNRAHLLHLLVADESIWNFEWNATDRSRSSTARYYATYKPVLHYRQVIERGEWFRGAARYFGSQKIGCDFAARPIMNRRLALKRYIATAMRYLKLRLTARLRFRLGRADQ
ncbi:MAG TPA: hypothetical protein VFA65_19600 [Bryobacteraceae bacterium]|nr:hypothetical protein [Bryobacteraceae bacterium]